MTVGPLVADVRAFLQQRSLYHQPSR
jgi:hypothetical protein